tara:strand:+ start:280 stop:498 length:219 start_codon:yes stop_codon:yes gene_type:complete
MARKYGAEQRKFVKHIREKFILELEALYLEKFEMLNSEGLGEGMINKLTQTFLLSREGAITPLEKEIEGPFI